MTAERTNLPFAIQSEETSPAQTGHLEPVGYCTAAFRKAVVCVSCSISASGMTAVRTKPTLDCPILRGWFGPNRLLAGLGNAAMQLPVSCHSRAAQHYLLECTFWDVSADAQMVPS